MTFLKAFFETHGLIIVSFLEILLIKLGIFFLFVFTAELIAKLLKKDQTGFDIAWTMKGVVEVFLIFTAFQALTVFFTGDIRGANVAGLAAFWSLIQYSFLLVLVLFFVSQVYGAPLAQLGLHGKDFGKNLAKSAEYVVYLGLLCAVVKILYTYEILEATTKITRPLRVKELFEGGVFAYMRYALVLVVSPLAEECFYRGFLYPVVRNKTGAFLAIALVSTFFTILHFDAHFFVLVFVLSCALCYLYETRRSIVPPVLLHSAYNLFVVLGLFHY